MFDRPGLRIYTGGDDNIVKIWCARTGWLIHSLRPHQTEDPRSRKVGQITDFSINQSNTILATSSSDRTIRTWNLTTFEQLCYINVGKQIMSMSLSPSPDESNQCLIVPCSDAKTRIYLWDSPRKNFSPYPISLDSGTLVKDSADHCCFNPTGTKFIVGGQDGIVYLFSVNPVDKKDPNNDLGLSETAHPKLIHRFIEHKVTNNLSLMICRAA